MSNSNHSSDSRNEYLQADNDGLLQTLRTADANFEKVKQTSDATLDSRLLIDVADASHRKITSMALKDARLGVDVDEFVSKCISFMRRGPTGLQEEAEVMASRSSQRTHRNHHQEEDDEDAEAGDPLNWEWLGRKACFPFNARPPVSGFLLGPLSVEKKARQATQRRARQQRSQVEAIRPEELQEKDMEKQNNNDTTSQCLEIYQELMSAQQEHQKGAEEEVERMQERTGREPSEAEIDRIMEKHGISSTGGIPIYKFCINPNSFGQSVENLFYVAFLIRDGRAGIAMDHNGLPTLGKSKQASSTFWAAS